MSALRLSNLGVICPSLHFLNFVGAAKCSLRPSVTEAPRAERARPLRPYTQPPRTGPGSSSSASARPCKAPSEKAENKPAPAPFPSTPTRLRGDRSAAACACRGTASRRVGLGTKFSLNVIRRAGPGQEVPRRGQWARSVAARASCFPYDPFVSPLMATVVVKEGRRDCAATRAQPRGNGDGLWKREGGELEGVWEVGWVGEGGDVSMELVEGERG